MISHLEVYTPKSDLAWFWEHLPLKTLCPRSMPKVMPTCFSAKKQTLKNVFNKMQVKQHGTQVMKPMTFYCLLMCTACNRWNCSPKLCKPQNLKLNAPARDCKTAWNGSHSGGRCAKHVGCGNSSCVLWRSWVVLSHQALPHLFPFYFTIFFCIHHGEVCVFTVDHIIRLWR